ncbi:MAG TPA: GAF domain-containing protein [Anaerolineales bacterium]|nr:GAF domain-containing protein [Anaerolineales bacterium]
MAPRWSRHLWWILLLSSLTALGGWVLRPWAVFQPNWLSVFISIALIAFLVNLQIPFGEAEVSLSHAISLTLGLAEGPGAAGVALTVGSALGELARALYRRRSRPGRAEEWLPLRAWALGYSRHALSMFGGLAIYAILGGRPLSETHSLPLILPAIGLALSFSTLFLALHWITRLLLESRAPTRRETTILVLIAFLPVPFAVVSAASYALFERVALAVYGGVALIVTAILRSLMIAERDLQHRLQELSTLSRVSQAMRTSLDMDSLLTTIYLQVAHLLQADNFYIALHDADDDVLTYPLAIKNGRRQHWPNRPLSDRLTERVIRTAAPILIRESAPMTLRQMGLPELNNAPEAWLGVPLLNPERAIGCLAVFHTRLGATLSEKDLQLLTTLAGQASVAIENALLYDQTRRRAQALASLNEITASISSTLDPEKALELASLSMVRVGGGQKSAIYLLDPQRRQLFLARATNLSDSFLSAALTIPLEDSYRTSTFHSSEPHLVPDTEAAPFPEELRASLLSEGIRALAEFPLVTPEGTIGQVSVYFSQAQRFRSDQIELLKTFAGQAALAVANTRAYAETDQALRRRVEQLSTLEAIGRELSATLDSTKLGEVILDHALRITSSEFGHVLIFDPKAGGLRLASQRGYHPASTPTTGSRVFSVDIGVFGRAFRNGVPTIVPENSADPDYLDWTGGKAQSAMSIPMLHQGRCLGVITVERSIPGGYWPEHEQSVSQLAAPAAVALINANLYQQLQMHLNEQSTLYQASARIAATLESQGVALAVAEGMAMALSAFAVVVSQWDPADRTLRQLAAVEEGRPIKKPGRSNVSMADAPALATSMKQGKPVQWSLDSAPSAPDRAYLAEHHQSASILVLPLAAGDQLVGVIEICSLRERLFDDNELRTAQTIASQAAIALQNTILFQSVSENHDRLMAVLNSTQEGMLMADPSGNILLANHQLTSLTGLALERTIGANLADPDLGLFERLGFSAGEIAQRLSAMRAGHTITGSDATFSVERPAHRTLMRAESPVRDAAGRTLGWLVVLRDISEERELAEARRNLTEMIVHDLRSPLSAILGSLKLIERSLPAGRRSPILSQALTVSQKSSSQVLGLVESLLDIAKLESGELQLSREAVELDKLCADLVESHVHEANQLGVILSTSVDGELPAILADPEKLRRILANLLDNALKFTPAGGRIDLGIRRELDGTVLSVADTGPGIPEEFRELIFQRFAQVPGIVGRRRGTGLGLAFAKLAVEAHGGRIWVEHNSGGGSVFYIWLPDEPLAIEQRRPVDARPETSR